MNTNAVSILDLPARRLLTTVLLDDVDLGAANPWGVAVSADGAWLYVAHAGTHEVSVINRPALHEKIEAVAAGKPRGASAKLEDVPSDLSFLVGIRQRIKMPGNGPRGLALAGSRVVAAQYFTDDLAVIRRSETNHSLPQVISLGPAVPLSQARKGEMHWNDARLCFQHWQSSQAVTRTAGRMA